MNTPNKTLATLATMLAMIISTPKWAGAQQSTTSDQYGGTHTLKAGEKAKDADGREVENNASRKNQKVKIKYNGGAPELVNGVLVFPGKFEEIEVPSSNGADDFKVNTNNKPTEVNVEDSGSDSNPHEGEITGGNATVNIEGNNNDIDITGGANNTVNINGKGNDVTASGGSSGTCNVNAQPNHFGTSGANNWNVNIT